MEVETPQIDWNVIYRQLYAAAIVMLKAKAWLRGGDVDVVLLGKEAADYVQETICRYWEHPEKYKSVYGRSLLNYLRIHILQSLISNTAKRKENTTTERIESFEGEDATEDGAAFKKAAHSFVEAYFDEEIDYQSVVSRVEEEIKGKTLLENIFTGQCCDLQPREIMDEFKISEQDFHNGKRQLRTAVFRVIKEFKLQKEFHQKIKAS